MADSSFPEVGSVCGCRFRGVGVERTCENAGILGVSRDRNEMNWEILLKI